MYSMVLMAALTSGTDLPDMGRRGGRGGGCCGCYGGMSYGGCYGGGYGGGCYGGGWGGCYGGGYASGGCYGGGYGRGYAWGGTGVGYGGYAWGASPSWGGYASGPTFYGSGTPIVTGGYGFGTPIVSGYGTPMIAGNTGTPGTTQSFYMNPGNVNQGNEARILVHLPADATLTIDGQPTQSRSGTRLFTSPPLEPGKTYTYTLRAEMNRDGRMANTKRTVEVRAGQTSEVTLDFSNSGRDGERLNAPGVPD
jgi:uncharacterized protein (TIGR03000 family)